MAPQREWFEKDYYKTLGVPSTATAKEITSAYRKLAKKHHPDTNPGDDELFKEISAAYDVLGDADKRKEYDEVRTMGPAAGGFGGGGFPGGFGGGGAAPSGSRTPATSATCSAASSAAAGGGGQAGPQRGSDVETELHLTFEDAIRGVTTSVNVTTDARCHTCSGSGSAPGTRPDTCPRCGGTGIAPGQPGDVLPQPDLPAVQRARHHRHPPLPDVLGQRGRAPQPLGQGAPARRRRGRRSGSGSRAAAPRAGAAGPPATSTSSPGSAGTASSGARAAT